MTYLLTGIVGRLIEEQKIREREPKQVEISYPDRCYKVWTERGVVWYCVIDGEAREVCFK